MSLEGWIRVTFHVIINWIGHFKNHLSHTIRTFQDSNLSHWLVSFKQWTTTSGYCLKRKEWTEVHGFYSDDDFSFKKAFATKKSMFGKILTYVVFEMAYSIVKYVGVEMMSNLKFLWEHCLLYIALLFNDFFKHKKSLYYFFVQDNITIWIEFFCTIFIFSNICLLFI